MTTEQLFGPPIYTYTQRQAVEDGILVDLMQSETVGAVREAGFRVPVLMTTTAFEAAVWPIDNPEADRWLESRCQDLQGRLWDVLWVGRLACLSGDGSYNDSGHPRIYQLSVVRHDVTPRGRRKMLLKFVIGATDSGDPCIVIMLPDEDQ